MSLDALFKAIEKGDLESVKKLSSTLDINQQSPAGVTPLTVAVSQAILNPEGMYILMYLLEKGADPNIRDIEGYTPLFMAAEYGYRTVFQTLLEYRGNPNYLLTDSGAVIPSIPLKMVNIVLKAVDSYKTNSGVLGALAGGDTVILEVLFKAIEKGNFAEVKTIVPTIDINRQDPKNGWTALAAAAKHSANPEGMKILKYLLENGANPNIPGKNGFTPLYVAIAYLYEGMSSAINYVLKQSSPEAIPYLLDHGATVDLSSAALIFSEKQDRKGLYFQALKDLVENGAKIDSEVLSIVYRSKDRGFAQKSAKYLIEKGVQPIESFLNAILVYKDDDLLDYDLIDYFLDKGAFQDKNIFQFVTYLDISYIEKFLVSHPNSINIELFGKTPLAIAAKFRTKKFIQFLLDHGADPTKGHLLDEASHENKPLIVQAIKEYHKKTIKDAEQVSSYLHLYDVLGKDEKSVTRQDNFNPKVLQIVSDDLGKLGIQVLYDSNSPEVNYPSNLEEILGQGPTASVLSKSTLTRVQEEELYRFWRKISMYVFNSGIDVLLHPRDLVWLETNTWALARCRIVLYQPQFIETLGLKNAEVFLKLEKGENINSTYGVRYLNNELEIAFASGRFSSPIEYYVNYPEAVLSVQKRCDESIKSALRQPGAKTIMKTLFFLKLVPFTTKMIEVISGSVALSKAICDTFDFCILDAQRDKERKRLEKGNKKGSPTTDKPNIIENTRVITALRDETEQYHLKLFPEYQKALDKYTRTAYRAMNECLRESNTSLNSKNCEDETKKLIIQLDKVLANPDAPKLKETLTVYRGINADNLQSREVAKALQALVPGSYWEDRGFVSTSVQHPPSGFVGRTCCIMEIRLPAGTHAYYIGKNSSVSHEEEVILLPGILLKYVGRREKGIRYQGDRIITTYLFECAGCTPKTRFAISQAPEEMEITTKRLPFQPQDLTVGTDRLSLFNLLGYNKFLPEIWKENKREQLALRVCTFNVHEFRDKSNTITRDAMETMILEISPDVLGIQEATGKKVLSPTYNTVSCEADMGSHGEVLRNDIVVKNGIEIFFKETVDLMYERCMTVVGISVRGFPILIANLHLDVSSSDKRLQNINHATQAMGDFAKRYKTNNVIMMGDFNSYSRTDYDDNNFSILKEIRKGRSMDIFEAIEHMEQQGYRDTFSLKKVLKSDGSFGSIFPPKNTNYYGGRIDFIFVSKDFDYKLIGAYAYYTGLSDHIAIIADFRLV